MGVPRTASTPCSSSSPSAPTWTRTHPSATATTSPPASARCYPASSTPCWPGRRWSCTRRAPPPDLPSVAAHHLAVLHHRPAGVVADAVGQLGGMGDVPQHEVGGLAGLQRAVGRRHAERPGRSEEHTSELQSLMRISYAVF